MITRGGRPVPAPDGTLIAVHRGMIDVGETWVIAADGSNPRLAAPGAFLRWSPEARGSPGSRKALRPRLPSSALTAGLRVLASGYDPAWSPAGVRIAYAVVEDTGRSAAQWTSRPAGRDPGHGAPRLRGGRPCMAR